MNGGVRFKGNQYMLNSESGQYMGIAVILRLLFFACGKAQRIVIFHLGLRRKVRVGSLLTKPGSTNHFLLNQIQVLVGAIPWRFESSFRHLLSTT